LFNALINALIRKLL